MRTPFAQSIRHCYIGFLFTLLATSLAAAELKFAGTTRYQVQGATVTLTAERINNTTATGISGTGRLELWAFSSPYAGVAQTGYRTAVYSVGALAGGAAITGVSATVAYTAPPAGTRWYYTLILTEFTGGNINDGYVVRDWTNFPGAPTIQTQPQGATVAAGDAVTLSVVAVGTPNPTYQWQKLPGDGTAIAIPGATAATLRFPAVLSTDAGVYRVTVTNSEGTATSSTVTLAVNTVIVKRPSRLDNLSVRSIAGTGDQVLTVGFVIDGGAKQVLVRGVGPSLASFNVTGFLTDPQLRLFNSERVLVSQNDDWGGSAGLANAFSAVGAFPLPPASKDAALFGLVAAGASSVQVTGAAGTGVALVEAYDADPASAPGRFINLSARNQVGVDSNALFVGFVIGGTGAKTVLIRGIGPSLSQFGVGGVLADPRLTVYDGQSRPLTSNDDWPASLATTFASVGAFPLPPGSKDAALVVTLPPGPYSAELTGVNRGTGVGLVEVYELPDTNNSPLNVGVAGDGIGTVTLGQSGPIVPGSPVTLTANPAAGSVFVGWSGPIIGTIPTVTIPADPRLPAVAVFTRDPSSPSGSGGGTGGPGGGSTGGTGSTYTLTTQIIGDGTGTIATTPTGTTFPAGTVVTVTATPNAGSVFAGWSGDLNGNAASQSLTMDANKYVAVVFLRAPTGGSGSPKSIYEGTYTGQFVVRYRFTEKTSTGAQQQRFATKSFSIALDLHAAASGAGITNLQVTRVVASDPWFGAQFGQAPRASGVQLPEPPPFGSTGGLLDLTFQNGINLANNARVLISSDGLTIGNPPTDGTGLTWAAAPGLALANWGNTSFLSTVPEFGAPNITDLTAVEATWHLTKSNFSSK